ncbi:MAG TPA: hypothetical protein PLZ77_00990 [Lachnospiraceae bacterium]|nr:hypothetical protein [Lachnospiraceae bacterium]HPF28659.1 hypothetical protein [Lachnospiraceae bacterium]
MQGKRLYSWVASGRQRHRLKAQPAGSEEGNALEQIIRDQADWLMLG